MLTSSAAASSVLNLFEGRDGHPLRLSDDAQALFVTVHLDNEQPQGRRRALRRASAHRETLLAILSRYEWQKRQAESGELGEMQRLSFACLDVEQYFLAVRASFDGLAHLISQFATKPGQTPSSFNEMQKWCTEPKKRTRLERLVGSEIIDLVAARSWFATLRSTRDEFVHFGATSLAIPVEDTVSFTVFVGEKRIRQGDLLEFNENLDDFELFVASTFGALLLFENALCRAIQSRGLKPLGFRSWSHKSVYVVLCQFVERLAARLADRGV